MPQPREEDPGGAYRTCQSGHRSFVWFSGYLLHPIPTDKNLGPLAPELKFLQERSWKPFATRRDISFITAFILTFKSTPPLKSFLVPVNWLMGWKAAQTLDSLLPSVTRQVPNMWTGKGWILLKNQGCCLQNTMPLQKETLNTSAGGLLIKTHLYLLAMQSIDGS